MAFSTSWNRSRPRRSPSLRLGCAHPSRLLLIVVAGDPLRVARGCHRSSAGTIQLNTRLTGRCSSPASASGVSNAPATTWLSAIAAIAPPQAALIRRLIDRNVGLCQYSRGTLSRAYCSVNGITGSSRKITAARIVAATARPYAHRNASAAG